MVPIFVFGHLNPDTDSICSAIAYAHLKHRLGVQEVTACRLGKINKETQFVLDYFQWPIPPLLSDIKPQVSDLNIYRAPLLDRAQPIKRAWDIMKREGKHLLPVVDEGGRLAGVVSISDIAKSYMELGDERMLKEYNTPFQNLLEVLDGEVLGGAYPFKTIKGDVYTDSTLHQQHRLSAGDIVITGHERQLQEIAMKSGAGCVIMTEGGQIEGPYRSECARITVPYSFFKTVKRVNQSIPIGAIMKSQNLVSFDLEDYVEEVREIMKNSAYRNFPVINREGLVQGTISRRHLIDFNRKKVILVDHNEKGQSIQGLDQAMIMEIIDHHRVADIQTLTPLFFRSEPVGSTATIVAKMYAENRIQPDQAMAGIMLSAIISDTLLFQSPTCTQEDRRIAEKLSEIAEISLNAYGAQMMIAGTSLEGKTPEEIYTTDMKKFTFGRYHALVAQINTADFQTIYQMKQQLKEVMQKLCIDKKCDMAVLMITDITLGGSELFAVGENRDLLLRAFEMELGEESIFLPGVVSRKKQIVPKLMNASQI